MSNYYIAVDIGASSGRLIAAWLDNGTMKTEEIHRFDNGVVRKNEHLCWEIDKLFCEIKEGLKKCKAVGKIPTTVGIDTWAVDFVLLDKNGEVIGDTVAYRDNRTDGMIEKVTNIIPQLEQYERTGIQPQVFNTIYQLMAAKDELNKAEKLLFVPEYLNYLLTGVMMTEYTNASTSGMVSAKTKNWDEDIINRLGYKKEIFGEIHMPSTVVGKLKDEIADEVGFSCDIILPCTHDTGSAVLAVPSNEKALYISSGTWSLMGCEIIEPNVSEESLKLGFTNEGGYDYRFRYLKNIMGLWMIQSVRRELNKKYSFDELCDMARESTFDEIIDVNDKS
ncbi:MAG: rhamnulokinase family protein, partial [Acutalibacteraceae bacterium]|nr:rhamnulokinase family protein [Acutalibacteraceae bacterium]